MPQLIMLQGHLQAPSLGVFSPLQTCPCVWKFPPFPLPDTCAGKSLCMGFPLSLSASTEGVNSHRVSLSASIAYAHAEGSYWHTHHFCMGEGNPACRHMPCQGKTVTFSAYPDMSLKIPGMHLGRQGKHGRHSQGLREFAWEFSGYAKTKLLKPTDPVPQVAGEDRHLQTALTLLPLTNRCGSQ